MKGLGQRVPLIVPSNLPNKSKIKILKIGENEEKRGEMEEITVKIMKTSIKSITLVLRKNQDFFNISAVLKE
jgi:hypothetical protein